MSKKIIDSAHRYTHSEEFEKGFDNEEIRLLLRQTLDLAQGLTNIHSNSRHRGIFSFDKKKLEKRVKTLLEIVQRVPTSEEFDEEGEG